MSYVILREPDWDHILPDEDSKFSGVQLGGAFTKAPEQTPTSSRIAAIDFDLCWDFLSTPYDKGALDRVPKQHGASTVRDVIFAECQAREGPFLHYKEDANRLYSEMLTLRSKGICDFVFITRNSVHNLETTLKHIYGVDPLAFPIISQPEEPLRERGLPGGASKAELLHKFYAKDLATLEGVCLVDDSWVTPNDVAKATKKGREVKPKEHERFEVFPFPEGVLFPGIKVCRPKRGSVVGAGFFQQPEKMEEFGEFLKMAFAAASPSNGEEESNTASKRAKTSL